MSFLKKIFVGFLTVFILFLLSKNFFGYPKTRQFYIIYKESYEKEKKKNIELKTSLLKKNSFSEIEKTIRNKLGLSRPGEITVIVPSPQITPSTSPTPTPPVYQQWINLFVK